MPTPATVVERFERSHQPDHPEVKSILEKNGFTESGFLRVRFPASIDPRSTQFERYFGALFQSCGGDTTTQIGIFHSGDHADGLQDGKQFEGFITSTPLDRITPELFEEEGIGHIVNDDGIEYFDLVLVGLTQEDLNIAAGAKELAEA